MKQGGQLAYVALGSNLDGPVRQVRSALAELDGLEDVRRLAHSPLYRSPPLGPGGQPDYVNAVALLETTLDPHQLLDRLQAIEQRHGRERGVRWGPRTLDLDLLLYGGQRIVSPRLRVPHPELSRRPFVLVPLHDIAPDLELPGLGPLADLLPAPGEGELEPIGDEEDA
jgi:2-amino-4-hydroxy-6-hydroxymethyldihydropteridine diphosphokinase